MKLTTLISPLLLLASATLAASSLPDFPFINVTGEAKLEVAPDKAQLQFVIRHSADTADKATATIYTQGRDLLAFLAAKGITEADIEASQIDKTPLYKDYNDRTIIGYEASQPITVTVNSLDIFPEVVNYLFTSDNVFSIRSSFDSSKRDSYEQELTVKAGQDATSRANNLAKALNVRIDSVYAISEDGGWNMLANNSGFIESGMVYAAMARSDKATDISGNLILPKHINLQKSVKVVYKLKK